MVFRHGLTAKFYYDQTDFSDYIDEVDPSFERAMAEYAVLGQDWGLSLPGIRSVVVAVSGLSDRDNFDEKAWNVFDGSTERMWAYLPDGDTVGNTAYMASSRINTFDHAVSTDDVIRAPVGVVGSDRADRGEVIHTLSAETTGDNGAAQDNTSSTSDGAEAYLIVTSATDTDALDVKLEHSADDITYSDLLTFTQVTAAGSEHQTATGTVNQYVRCTWTVTDVSGSPSFTFFVGWRRK